MSSEQWCRRDAYWDSGAVASLDAHEFALADMDGVVEVVVLAFVVVPMLEVAAERQAPLLCKLPPTVSSPLEARCLLSVCNSNATSVPCAASMRYAAVPSASLSAV